MRSFIANVGNAQERVTAELPLNAERPLLCIGMVQVQGEVDVCALLRKWCILRRRIGERKRVAAGIAIIRIDETSRRSAQVDLISPRRGIGPISRRERFGRVEEDSIRRTNTEFAVTLRVPGNPESRCEVQVT